MKPPLSDSIATIWLPDDERYFDYHHATNDTFDKVNRRELKMGAAAMAALIYIIDNYGL